MTLVGGMRPTDLPNELRSCWLLLWGRPSLTWKAFSLPLLLRSLSEFKCCKKVTRKKDGFIRATESSSECVSAFFARTHLRDGCAVASKTLPLRQLRILSIQRRQLLPLLQASRQLKYNAKLAASARGDCGYLLQHEEQIVFLFLEVLSFLLSL